METVTKRVPSSPLCCFSPSRHFTSKTRMLCQNAFLFKFVFSRGNKKTIGKISLTIEASNNILVLVVKWGHHENGPFKWESIHFHWQRERFSNDSRRGGGVGDISQRLYLLIELSFSKSLESNSCDVDWHDGKWKVLSFMLREFVNFEGKAMHAILSNEVQCGKQTKKSTTT